jgi:hypothetical protein
MGRVKGTGLGSRVRIKGLVSKTKSEESEVKFKAAELGSDG